MARGALSRVANIIRADIDELLNRMEDPRKLVPYLIREMEDAVEAAVEEAAGAVANERCVERRLSQARERSESWQRKAEEAVAAGDDGLARKALEHKVVEAAALEDLEKALEESRKAAESLKQQLAACRAKLKAARARQRTLIVRQAATRRRCDLREPSTRVDISAFGAYDRLTEQVARDEATAEVYARIVASESELDVEFEQLEQKQKVDEELRVLKEKLRGGTGEE